MSSNHPLKLLFVGRPSLEKGLPDLLKSLSLLRSYNWTLTIVGDMPTIDAQLPMDNTRLLLRGRMPNEQIPGIMRCHDLVVVPSRYETFGNVALEAMACGLPVIASATGGLRDIIAQGVTGFLFCPGDWAELAGVLKEIFEEKRDLAALGINGRKRVLDCYSWARVSSETFRLLSRLL